MRRLLALIATSAAVLLSAGGVAAASSTAPATHKPHPDVVFVLNETSGNFLIRDSNNLESVGNPVVEGSQGVFGPATDIQWHDIGTTFTFKGVTYENGNLQWQEHTGWCVGGNSSNTAAVMDHCNGGHGVVFPLTTRNGADVFINRAATQANGNSLIDLSGLNNGSQFDFAGDQLSGWFQRFTPGGQ